MNTLLWLMNSHHYSVTQYYSLYPNSSSHHILSNRKSTKYQQSSIYVSKGPESL